MGGREPVSAGTPATAAASKYLALWISLPLIAALMLCAGIGAALDDDQPTGSPQPAAATPPPSSAAPSASPTPSPSPTGDRAAFLAGLRTIGPDLIRGNEARAVEWGHRLCDDIRGGLSATRQAGRAAQRFSGSNVQVTEAQGAIIVTLAVRHLCPDAAAATTSATAPPPATRPATPPTTRTTAPAETPSDVYYRNCDAVRAAGKAPLRRGQPGYRPALDRDGDGWACDT